MTASISDCKIQLNKSLLFKIVFIAGWIPRLNYTFEKIKRTNAKYYSSSHLCVWGCVSAWFGRALAWHARGHRFDPGILHQKALYFVGSMVLFFLLKPIFWGLHCFACTVFKKECLPPGFSAGCCIIPLNRRSKRRRFPTIREATAFVDYRMSQP